MLQDNAVLSTSTSRQSGILPHLCLAGLIGMMALSALARSDRVDRAVDHYEAAEYHEARELLEQVVAETPSSEAYHWLGKSYGHLAKQAYPFKAMELARKTREALERAVELDGRNRAAVKDLKEFYQQAPAIVGGSQKRAARLQKQLATMDRNSQGRPDYPDPAENDS